MDTFFFSCELYQEQCVVGAKPIFQYQANGEAGKRAEQDGVEGIDRPPVAGPLTRHILSFGITMTFVFIF